VWVVGAEGQDPAVAAALAEVALLFDTKARAPTSVLLLHSCLLCPHPAPARTHGAEQPHLHENQHPHRAPLLRHWQKGKTFSAPSLPPA